MKKIIITVLGLAMMVMIFTGCGKDKKETNVEYDDGIRVEEIQVEEIRVEEIQVEEIQTEQIYIDDEYINEYNFNNNVNTWDNIKIEAFE